jgi:hypothetical protein
MLVGQLEKPKLLTFADRPAKVGALRFPPMCPTNTFTLRGVACYFVPQKINRQDAMCAKA